MTNTPVIVALLWLGLPLAAPPSLLLRVLASILLGFRLILDSFLIAGIGTPCAAIRKDKGGASLGHLVWWQNALNKNEQTGANDQISLNCFSRESDLSESAWIRHKLCTLTWSTWLAGISGTGNTTAGSPTRALLLSIPQVHRGGHLHAPRTC